MYQRCIDYTVDRFHNSHYSITVSRRCWAISRLKKASRPVVDNFQKFKRGKNSNMKQETKKSNDTIIVLEVQTILL